jgi:hypothetical protein
MEDVRDQLKEFTIVPVLSGGTPLPEQKHVTLTQREANTSVWNSLTEDQRNNLEYLDVVDIKPAPRSELLRSMTRENFITHLGGWLAGGFDVHPDIKAELYARITDEEPVEV